MVGSLGWGPNEIPCGWKVLQVKSVRELKPLLKPVNAFLLKLNISVTSYY